MYYVVGHNASHIGQVRPSSNSSQTNPCFFCGLHDYILCSVSCVLCPVSCVMCPVSCVLCVPGGVCMTYTELARGRSPGGASCDTALVRRLTTVKIQDVLTDDLECDLSDTCK